MPSSRRNARRKNLCDAGNCPVLSGVQGPQSRIADVLGRYAGHVRLRTRPEIPRLRSNTNTHHNPPASSPSMAEMNLGPCWTTARRSLSRSVKPISAPAARVSNYPTAACRFPHLAAEGPRRRLRSARSGRQSSRRRNWGYRAAWVGRTTSSRYNLDWDISGLRAHQPQSAGEARTIPGSSSLMAERPISTSSSLT